MDIVVKLPDKDYSVMLTKIMLACHGCKIIELPKGHGRLIDADDLDNHIIGHVDTRSCPTIIEADTESEGEE